MNNRYQNQRSRRASQIRSPEREERNTENPMSRSMFLGYSSFMQMFSGIFGSTNQQPNPPPVMIKRQTRISQKEGKETIDDKSRVLTLSSLQKKKSNEKAIFYVPRQKVLPPVFQNTQRITQKLFKILEQRVMKLQKQKVEPIFMETTISMTKDDIKQLFSHVFLQSRPQVIRNLNLILKCFAVHRLDIGQRKSVAMFAALLFGIFNEDTFVTFVQLCHVILSPCFLGFLTQQQQLILKVQQQIQIKLEDKCPGVYVFLLNKYKISTKFYVSQWIGSLFLSLQIDGVSSKLDRYYENNQDEFILRVIRYLFIHKFSKNSFVHLILCLMKSLQKEIFRQDNRQIIIEMIKKPRVYLNEKLFFNELSNDRILN